MWENTLTSPWADTSGNAEQCVMLVSLHFGHTVGATKDPVLGHLIRSVPSTISALPSLLNSASV